MNSDQLDLWEDEVARLPWRGQSPRSLTLTKCSEALFSRREPQKDACVRADPDQLDLWLPANRAPWVYQGASLLMEV